MTASNKRRLITAGALVGLSLSMGLMLQAAEKAADKKETVPDKRDELVQDHGTVNNLIEYGRKHQQPLALITAAQMLDTLDEPKETVKAEGAEEGVVPNKNEEVKKLLAEARKMKSANEVVKNMAAQVEDNLGASRGAPTGPGCKWEGYVPPFSQTKKPVVLNLRFVGGRAAQISVAKVFNIGVPLQYTVLNPAGQSVGTVFTPKNDGIFQLQIRNNHSATVLVKVITN